MRGRPGGGCYRARVDALLARSDRSPAPRRAGLGTATGRLVRAARRDSRTPTLLALVAVLAGSLAGFAHVVEDYLTGDPLVDWDVRLASWLHQHAADPLVALFHGVTIVGSPAVLGLGTAAAAFVLLRRGRANDAAVALLAAGGAGVLDETLKLVFHRPRPELAFLHLETYSFPSGHAAVSAATFLVFGFLAAKRVHGLRRRAGVLLAAAAATAVVAFSRLYLGVHYLSDVLAGASLGLAWASACLIVYVAYGDRDVLRLVPARARRPLERIRRGR